MATDTTDHVPSWWDHAPGDWPTFRDSLRWAMELRGEPMPPSLGPSLDSTRGVVALDRLATRLQPLPQSRWPAAVARYLADSGAPAPGDPAVGLGAVRAHLLPRDAVPDGVAIQVQLAYDLVGTIVVLGPSGDRWATTTDLERWGVAAEQAWDTAIANMRHDRVSVERQGAVTTVVGTQRLDVTGHALRLAELHPRAAPDGFLVGVPHRAVVLFTPVEGVEWVGLLRELPGILGGLYGGQFGALSREVYWAADGRWERVIVENTEDKLTIGASERFNEVYRRVLRNATGS